LIAYGDARLDPTIAIDGFASSVRSPRTCCACG
jgi:hypothetical protein